MVGDRDRAEDITQDTFIKAYRKLDTLTDEISTRSWLYRIADEHRHRRDASTALLLTTATPRIAPIIWPGPDAQVMAGMLDDSIQRALLRLRPNQRQCLS